MIILSVADHSQRVPPGQPDQSITVVTPSRNKVREVCEVYNAAGRELLPESVDVFEGVHSEGPVVELLDKVGDLQELSQLADRDEARA